jgi:hypothetical protein
MYMRLPVASFRTRVNAARRTSLRLRRMTPQAKESPNSYKNLRLPLRFPRLRRFQIQPFSRDVEPVKRKQKNKA